jgi:hypothetical protein
MGEIVEDNSLATKGYQIENIARLKRKDNILGTPASVGIWLDTEAAKWLINNGLLVGQRFIESNEIHQVKRKVLSRSMIWPSSVGAQEGAPYGHWRET